MNNSAKFIRYTPTSFAGLHEGMKLVIDFEPETSITAASGDQGVGKTSFLNGLRRLLGDEMAPNAINSKDKKVSAKLNMVLPDGRKVETTINKSNIVVKVIQEDGSSSIQSSPVDFLKKHVGPLGISPMFLKDMSGEKQVAWLRSIAKLAPEELALEQDIIVKRKETFDTRTNVNREVKQYQTELAHSPFVRWDKDNKVYVTNEAYTALMAQIAAGAADQEKVVKEFEAAGKKTANLTAWTAALKDLKAQKVAMDTDIQTREETIARLQKELEVAKQGRDTMVDRIVKNEKAIEEIKDAPAEYEKARQANASLTEMNQNKKRAEDDAWKANAHAKAQDTSTQLTAKIDAYDVKMLELIQLITPKVEGLEVKVKRTIDPAIEAANYREANPEKTDAQVKAYIDGLESGNVDGIFYQGHSIDQLCESELWDLCLVLWKHMNVNVIFIENVNTLGSDAIERINWFAENGGHVFYSEMERGTKNLRISFQNKIPVVAPAEAEEEEATA